jgi:hypothetical protein
MLPTIHILQAVYSQRDWQLFSEETNFRKKPVVSKAACSCALETIAFLYKEEF